MPITKSDLLPYCIYASAFIIDRLNFRLNFSWILTLFISTSFQIHKRKPSFNNEILFDRNDELTTNVHYAFYAAIILEYRVKHWHGCRNGLLIKVLPDISVGFQPN